MNIFILSNKKYINVTFLIFPLFPSRCLFLFWPVVVPSPLCYPVVGSKSSSLPFPAQTKILLADDLGTRDSIDIKTRFFLTI